MNYKICRDDQGSLVAVFSCLSRVVDPGSKDVRAYDYIGTESQKDYGEPFILCVAQAFDAAVLHEKEERSGLLGLHVDEKQALEELKSLASDHAIKADQFPSAKDYATELAHQMYGRDIGCGQGSLVYYKAVKPSVPSQ
ncbi:MAG TPA: hypothetical protein VIN59_09675 [Alphaproteobacteria bacterium]